MNFILAVIPAMLWGINPIIISKIGGNSFHKLTGTSIGVMIVGILIFLKIHLTIITVEDFFLGFISGSAWTIGQYGQYVSYNKIGISRTMPFSTAIQLIGTGIIGGFLLDEWSSEQAKIIGIISVVLLILGATIISINRKEKSKLKFSEILFLMMTSIGYWIYSCVPKLTNTAGLSLFLAQAIGIAVSGIVIVLLLRPNTICKKESMKNILPGIFYGVAAVVYIIAAKENGVTLAYLIGQLNVVVSTLGGILIFHEFETNHEIFVKICGLTFIVIGSLITLMF